MRPICLWRVALVVGMMATAVATAEPPALREVPEPRLEGVDPEVAGQLREARQRLDSLLSGEASTPELAAAFGALGRTYEAYSLSDSALPCFQNAAALDPRDARWPYYAGALLQRAGRLDDALGALERVLELAPADAAARQRAAEVELALGRLEPAAGRFESLLADPSGGAAASFGLGQVALLERRYERAAEHLERALAAAPEASAAHYQLGIAYRQLGDRERARHHLEQAGNRRPPFPDPLFEELGELASGAALDLVDGALARAAGDHARAAEAFRRAVTARPDDLQARLLLAFSLVKLDRLEAARPELQEVLRRDPDNVSAHYSLGTLLARQERPAEAVPYLERALAGAAEFTDAHLALAAVQARLGRLEQAAESYRLALVLDPGNGTARLERALTLLQLGREEEAREELEGVVAREPDRGEALFRLAELESAGGRPERAIELLRRIETDQAQLQTLVALRLGRLLAAVGRYAEAAAEFAVAGWLRPDSEEAAFGRTLALLLGENYPEARLHLEESVRRLPQSRLLRHSLARLLAACPVAELRDGARALELARALLAEEARPDYAETVAMALAAEGRFAEAAEWQTRVLERARLGAPPEVVAQIERRLARYRSERPVLAPWLAGLQPGGVSR